MRYLSSSKSKLISIIFLLLMTFSILPASDASAATNDELCSLPKYQGNEPGSGGGYNGTELEACMFGAVAGRGNENINVCDKWPKVDTRREACQWGYNNFSKADGTVSSGPQDTPGSNGNTPSDNEHAQKTKEEVCKEKPDDSICKAGEKPKDPQCGELMESIGWWLCGPLTMGTKLADEMFKMFSAMLVMDPLPDPNNAASSTIYKTWVNLRDIANALLVLIFLMVIISQVSNLGISNYGIKKLLPRLIVIAVLINTSYFILQLVFDLSNVLGATLDKLIMNTVQTTPFDWGSAMSQLTLQTVTVGGAILGTAAAITIGGPSVLLFLAILLLPALFSFIGAIVAIFMRNLLVPIIAVLAPVALAASILPNTKSLFDKWMKIFIGLVFLYPLATIFFSALKFGAAVAQSQANLNDDPLTGVLAQLALMVGSGFTVYLALKSNSIASKIMGGVSGAVKSVTKPVTKIGSAYATEKMGLARRSFMNNAENKRGVSRLVGRGMNVLSRNKKKRALQTQLYDAENTSSIERQFSNDPTLIPTELRDTAAAKNLESSLREKRIAEHTTAQKSMTMNEIKAQAIDFRPEANEDARTAAVRYITENGNYDDIKQLMINSEKYGSGSLENQSIRDSVFKRGFSAGLGPAIGDDILTGRVKSSDDIDTAIASTIEKGMSPEALVVDAGMTKDIRSVAKKQSTTINAGGPAPYNISTEKMVQLSESADRVKRSDLAVKLKGDLPLFVDEISRL